MRELIEGAREKMGACVWVCDWAGIWGCAVETFALLEEGLLEVEGTALAGREEEAPSSDSSPRNAERA
jgi:hypothetical protein